MESWLEHSTQSDTEPTLLIPNVDEILHNLDPLPEGTINITNTLAWSWRAEQFARTTEYPGYASRAAQTLITLPWNDKYATDKYIKKIVERDVDLGNDFIGISFLKVEKVRPEEYFKDANFKASKNPDTHKGQKPSFSIDVEKPQKFLELFAQSILDNSQLSRFSTTSNETHSYYEPYDSDTLQNRLEGARKHIIGLNALLVGVINGKINAIEPPHLASNSRKSNLHVHQDGSLQLKTPTHHKPSLNSAIERLSQGDDTIARVYAAEMMKGNVAEVNARRTAFLGIQKAIEYIDW